jgi:cytochrome c-type biogenesis protein CcmH/NrfF
MRRPILVFAALLACAPLAATATDVTQPWHYDLEQHLMSPYCPGRTLTDCTSPQAAELRAWIASQEQAGRTRADVESQLYLEFGEVILQAPRAEGFGLAAYGIPAIAVLLGASLVFVFLRRQSARAAAAPPPPAAGVDPELDRLIDEEMRRTGTPAR